MNKLLQRFTQQELADILEISPRTLRRKLKPSNKPLQKRGRKPKINNFNLHFLRSCALTLKSTNQNFLADHISDCLNESISQPTICRSLKKAKVAYKGFTYQAIEQLRSENQAKIKWFMNVTLPLLLQSNANIFSP